MDRTVSAELGITAYGDCRLELQVAVARSPGLLVSDKLRIVHDSNEIATLEVPTESHGVLHLVTLPPGPCQVYYEAKVSGVAEIDEPSLSDLSVYRRPSRYIESDTFMGFALAEFAGVDPGDIVDTVSGWVSRRLDYIPGSSGPYDSARDTLLTGAGVCRDYAHLVITLLRALRVPARLAAVYAPGCVPMDFHAVVEAYAAGSWHVVDPTGLAPRQSLVRIATGRDSADTAFMTTISGGVDLDWSVVSAVADDGLPYDDITQAVVMG